MDTKIVIVEDEIRIARALQIELEYEGFTVHVEHDGLKALQYLEHHEVDLVLLDSMLPSLSGIELLRRIRKSNQALPIIMLTARDSTLDKVTGLNYGANDYITKPFKLEEVVARIRSTLRFSSILQRAIATTESHLHVNDLTIKFESRAVFRGSHEIVLTPKEFDLLAFLVKNKNKVVSRESIVSTIWGYDYDGESNIVDVFIRQLRKKIEFDDLLPLIHTIRSVGYMIREH
jgi:DNA-binding response OmpR family regulator